MSRKTVFQNDRLTIDAGVDHMLGKFIQVFDSTLVDETPEGEGLVFDWSQAWGIERNLTGIPGDDPIDIIREYLMQNLDEPDPNIFIINLN